MPVFAVLFAAASALAAQEAATDKPYVEPCKADIPKFCKGIDPSSEEIIGCLKDHREQVSDTCKARLAQMRVKPKANPPAKPAPAPAR
jgi:predicted Fe-S protein YdhL (DUF1289 family)